MNKKNFTPAQKIAKESTISFIGNLQQNIDDAFTGSNALYNLKIDNNGGLLVDNSVEVSNQLILTKGIISIGQFGIGIINFSQFGIGIISISQFTVAVYALAQIAFAYSLIAQVGLYVSTGYGQVVWNIVELIKNI